MTNAVKVSVGVVVGVGVAADAFLTLNEQQKERIISIASLFR